MRALIIGAAGFVGPYLARHLADELGYEVYATKLENEKLEIPGVNVVNLDILSEQQVDELFEAVKPEMIFHLAAQSSVAVSWKRPALTADINIKGGINVLEAARKLDPTPKMLMIGSSEEYGFVEERDNPVSEAQIVKPANVYAATKACQNMISQIYVKAYGMDIKMVRAFNHIGPNQLPQFVVADFCKQVAEIEAGKKEPVISVGNLAARRDFTDVRDIVRAYGMIALKGVPGETYNVGSGEAIRIEDILNLIIKCSERDIKVVIDKDRFRPIDTPVVMADVSKLKAATGWERRISLETTIRETLDYWRRTV